MSNFPTSLDSLTDPTATSKLNSPPHSAQHSGINDAVEKIEAKIGVDGSAVTTSHDYKLSGVTGTNKAVSLTGTETQTNKTLTAPVIASMYQDAGKTKLLTVPNTASDTLAALAATQTFTNKRITKRVAAPSTAATQTIDCDSYDMCFIASQQQNVTFAAPSGTPTSGQTLVIRILDDGNARTITWNAIFRASTDLALPTTTTANKTIYCGFIYNAAAVKWDLIAYLNNF